MTQDFADLFRWSALCEKIVGALTTVFGGGQPDTESCSGPCRCPLVRPGRMGAVPCSRMLLLDHVFVCVDRDPPELGELRQLGLTSDFSRAHSGQGTCNELVLFKENYLELLFVNDRREAEENMVRLDRRCDWAETGASPFGIALRGPKSELGDEPLVHYTLEGLNGGLWIVQRSLEDARLPLVILFDRADPPTGAPASRDYAPELFEHACGALGIGSIELATPGVDSIDKLPLPANLMLREAENPQLHIELRGATLEGQRVGSLMTFV